ncbi:MAG: hypothetical protein AB8B93_09495 [Pseudomonadales bacterium]
MLFCLLWATAAHADRAANAPSPTVDLRQSSDAALTTMASNWDELDAATRRTLLREMQRRMAAARQGRSPSRAVVPISGTLQIRSERRFGRRVRQSDGSLVTIETRVVQVRKRPETVAGNVAGNVAGDQAGISAEKVGQSRSATPFGLGFEQRSASRRVILVPAKKPSTVQSYEQRAATEVGDLPAPRSELPQR